MTAVVGASVTGEPDYGPHGAIAVAGLRKSYGNQVVLVFTGEENLQLMSRSF